ncbi:Zinc finger and BTB domain-containing protein 20 [Armadillidium nasatum]|uniref:Zinc finger and BTB domain-containing protein 20 n=1 Tax=Armadillidium nasatum TaxID=96803 RepID=A0A5N5T1U0_9CRUS|nr:Zinc finger and BTB domain-containing protein 20 [Armadillidium nasatum]
MGRNIVYSYTIGDNSILSSSYRAWIPSVYLELRVFCRDCHMFLPETRNKHLFETVSQLEEDALRKKNRKGTENTKDEAKALTVNEKSESNI